MNPVLKQTQQRVSEKQTCKEFDKVKEFNNKLIANGAFTLKGWTETFDKVYNTVAFKSNKLIKFNSKLSSESTELRYLIRLAKLDNVGISVDNTICAVNGVLRLFIVNEADL